MDRIVQSSHSQTLISLVGWGLFAGLLAWFMFTKGQANERAKVYGEKIEAQEVVVDSLEKLVVQKDSVVAQERARADSARSRVVVVDKIVQPMIDSALATIMVVLDSAQQEQLQGIVYNFELRLEARDDQIASMSRFIAAQDSVIAVRDTLITQMRELQRTTFAALENERKRNERSLFSKAAAYVPAVASLIIIGREVF